MTFPKAVGYVWLMIFALLALSVPAVVTAHDGDEDERPPCEIGRNQWQVDVDEEDGERCARGRCEGRCDGECPLKKEEHCGAFCCGFACATMMWLLLAVWIAICVWVYRDAVRREMESPVLWLILLLIAGLIGLIIYLVVRSPLEE